MEKILDFFRTQKTGRFHNGNKRGAELSINTVVIVILAVIALVITIFIFSSSARQFAANIFSKLKFAMGIVNSTQINP
ncbi:MAG: hypothetical protein WC475_04910 [Candidatus Paceibacterota bacterium]